MLNIQAFGLQIGLLEAAGLRECEEEKETAASQAVSQSLYWLHDDKTRESRPGSPLPSMQNGAFPLLEGARDHARFPVQA